MGKVYLVGAGPGDPGLLTLKAICILERADVVIHDRLVSAKILALAGNAVLVDGGKRQGEQELIQARINELMAQHTGEGRMVVRLKCGDPMVFAWGAEWEYLVGAVSKWKLCPAFRAHWRFPRWPIPPTCRGIMNRLP
jgi:siroheme synthase